MHSEWRQAKPAAERRLRILAMILVPSAVISGCTIPRGGASEWAMVNPTGREYRNEPVRLKLAVPADVGKGRYAVTEDGRSIPYQVEVIDGKPAIWVAASLTATQTHTYAIAPGRPARAKPMVAVREGKDTIVLDNGVVAVRVPAGGVGLAGPVGQVRLPNGKWVGRSFWHTDRKLTNFTARVIGDGTIFGKVRLCYEFEGKGGLLNESPAFHEIDITLQPGKAHAIIEESHAMGRDDWWEFDCGAGWAPRQAVVKPHFGGFGRPTMKDPDGKPYPFPPQTLKVGQTRMHDTLLNLLPRWSQAYDDGWLFAATDGKHAVAALVCRPGKWLWPHDNMIAIKVKESADYAGLRCPTRRGRRYWYLAAGPKADWDNPDKLLGYVLYHGHEGLDKLFQEYILSWPGLQPPADKNMSPAEAERWASGAGQYATRSSAFVGWGPRGNPGFRRTSHPINALTRAQALFDPDTFGDYWLFWSPENPNFATHWIHGAYYALMEAAKYPGVKEHPYFKRMQDLARMKAREEAYHSVTLPSGAGQECFGYMSRGSWHRRERMCRDQLGVDPGTRPWLEAAGRFLFRASHPIPGGGRKSHPGGDTHPPGPDVYQALRLAGVKDDVAQLGTEELEGFGVIFRNRPGTPEETYLAFKAGPNRGHFHGDGLAFHYCAYGRPQVVDHHCSYGPRAGGEHMHNRLAFHTADPASSPSPLGGEGRGEGGEAVSLPYANMDGYERLIAFKTARETDVAIGQVESERLRITEKFPPEKWDWDLPQQRFDVPLKYRRTVVMMKAAGDTPDYFVFRDQYAGPDLYSTYCLHVYGGTCATNGSEFDFDPVRVTVVKPDKFRISRHDWSHKNGGLEETKGLRLTVKGENAEFITVMMPRPIKRATVDRIVLKDAIKKDVRRKRAPKPDWRTYDLVVNIMREGGKPDTRALLTAPGMHCAYRWAGDVSVKHSDGQMEIKLRATLRGRGFANGIDYAIQVKSDGKAFAGEYRGTLTLSPGKREQKVEVQGTASGARNDNASPLTDLYTDAKLPKVEAIPGGVRVGRDEILFGGGLDDVDATAYVTVRRGGKALLEVTGQDIDMDRSQGEIGLFYPDAGYPFGDIPDWLLRQRTQKPDWYEDVWPPASARK